MLAFHQLECGLYQAARLHGKDATQRVQKRWQLGAVLQIATVTHYTAHQECMHMDLSQEGH